MSSIRVNIAVDDVPLSDLQDIKDAIDALFENYPEKSVEVFITDRRLVSPER